MQEFLDKAIPMPTVKEKLAEIKGGWDNLHIGQGHFMAWVRQGFKELTHLLLPAFPQGQHVVEEPGLWGNPTQGEVAGAREEDQATKQRIAALNEEPMQTQTSVRSPADLVEGNLTGPVQGQQQQNTQQVSPADLLESNTAGPVQGQQQQSKQDISPADLLDGQGTAPPQEQQGQTQRQGQSHGISM